MNSHLFVYSNHKNQDNFNLNHCIVELSIVESSIVDALSKKHARVVVVLSEKVKEVIVRVLLAFLSESMTIILQLE